MRRLICAVASAFVPILLTACTDASQPTDPTGRAASRSVAANSHVPGESGDAHEGSTLNVAMLDKCDPATFNHALGDGTCVRHGKGITFQKFIAELERNRIAKAWRFEPGELEPRIGETILAHNGGGETHTFTRVEEFGGGVVPMLNDLSGNPDVAPECTMLGDDDFVPPGGTYKELVDVTGDLKFQCCIHPWMRTVAHVENKEHKEHKEHQEHK
ncbi:MAG TPA: hypothetical protein VHE78_13575 [Gemmatimonadaceae bacterium]|nr:hypothetical protein [Gemmatimonadaceae bacterium]